MYNKDFNILIQCCLSKFFLINELYVLGCGQSFGNGLGFLDEFFLSKLDVSNIKDKEKYAKNHFYLDFGQ